MDTKDVQTVAMFGPSISEPTKIVNRDVPVGDIQAYKAAGYREGSVAEEPVVLYTLADAIIHNDGVDVTKEKVTRGTKRK